MVLLIMSLILKHRRTYAPLKGIITKCYIFPWLFTSLLGIWRLVFKWNICKTDIKIKLYCNSHKWAYCMFLVLKDQVWGLRNNVTVMAKSRIICCFIQISTSRFLIKLLNHEMLMTMNVFIKKTKLNLNYIFKKK